MTQIPVSLTQAFPEKPRPFKLAHVVFRTPNFEEMKDFYRKLLGAYPKYENDQASFMTYDDEHHRVAFINMPHLKDQDHGAGGVEHIAFTYPDLPSLLATYVYNKQQGILPFWSIIHGPTISFYYYDPDRNRIELQYDVFPTTEATDAYFASGAYDENFMGIVIDPDKMVADYEAGVPVEELCKRPPLPEGMTPWDMHRE